MKHNLHGDIGLHPATDAQKQLWNREGVSKKTAFEHVLQSSDVTGNRHVIRSQSPIEHAVIDGVELVYSSEPYRIIHEGGDAEHGVQGVEAGLREVRHEVEYDPWANELRAVID